MRKLTPVSIILGTVLLSMFYAVGPHAANDEYRQWLQQQTQDFQEYKDKRDKQFTKFLKSHWTAVELLQGKSDDETPKPVVMPVAELDDSATPAPGTRNANPVITLLPVPEAVEETNVVAAIPAADQQGQRLTLDFFGQELSFFYPREMAVVLTSIDKDSISHYWSKLSRQEYEGLLEQLSAQRDALQLTDWAYASLVNKLSMKIHPGSSNAKVMLSWFLLVKAGYKARIAYNSNTIYLLLPSRQEMFDVPYFTFGNKRYYAVSFDGGKKSPGQVFTYEGEYPDAIGDMDMSVTAVVAVNRNLQQRHLSFTFKGQTYNIEVKYDRGRIAFFKSYPQLELALYFSSGVDPETASPLLAQLSAHMQGMSERDAINFLLRFVQVSLKYGTDEQQFGRENYLFPEETLFYPYSDCEDRAVLFAWLVRSLLGLEVIGLDYPGHVATAVRLSGQQDGNRNEDWVEHMGQVYTVADPTYINANAGMTMPDYKNVKPSLIIYQ